MVCPQCDEGVIQTVFFKKEGQVGYLCNFCGALWYEGETIGEETAHFIGARTKDEEMEYTFVDRDETEKDQEDRSVMYPKIK